jgi:hypothetical protein
VPDFWGNATTDELADLIKSKDYVFAQIKAAYEPFASSWSKGDPATWGDWSKDWQALQSRYLDAKTSFGLSNQGRWDAIVKACNRNAKAGDRGAPPPGQTGDLQDVYNRLTKALAANKAKPVDLAKNPQPTARDPQLDLLNKLAPYDVVGAATGDTTAAKWLPNAKEFAGLAALIGILAAAAYFGIPALAGVMLLGGRGHRITVLHK